MGARRHSPLTAQALRSAGEQALIPEHTILSNLLEGLRLERSSYNAMAPRELPIAGRSGADELTGFFFLSGEVRFSFPDKREIQARRMDYLLIGRGVEYSVAAMKGHGPCTIMRTSFKLASSVGQVLFRLLPEVIYINAMSEAESRWHAELGQLIADHPESSRAAAPAINHRLVEASLISLIQGWMYRNPPRGFQFDSPQTARIYPSLRAMHDAPERSWTVPSLALISGMSRTLFVDTFRTVTGDTPARYLTELRLEKGRELLRSTQLSLDDVAQRTGYGSDIAFIRAFRRQFKLSPGQFRRGG